MSENRVNRREFMRTTALGAGGVAVGMAARNAAAFSSESKAASSKILNYNENMEYRRLGKTELTVSAVCLGGHWKRVNVMEEDFDKNRREVVSHCIDIGINYVDACSKGEVVAYSKALKGRRDKMYMALSHCGREVRNKDFRSADKLLGSLDEVLRDSKQDYTDLWRITCFEPGGKHAFNTSCEVIEALTKAKEAGKARFIGISSHDRRWLKMMIEYFPEIQVILFPYTAKTKKLPKDSLFDSIEKCDVGVFGIKPFASNSLFKGSSAPDDPNAEADNRMARLALRCILCNPAITAPIPGLIGKSQVDNVAKAVTERRQLDVAEALELEQAMEVAWANLPKNYQWLKDWEYV